MNHSHELKQYAGNTTLQPENEQHKKASIVMVDDDLFMLQLLESFLSERGYQNFIAINDSTIAVEKILSKMPEVVLLDLNMPQVDGFEVLEKLRKEPKAEHLPIIVLTSSTDAENKLRALDLGATDFLAKPVDQSELALRLRNTLNAKAHLDRLENFDSLTGLPNKRHFMSSLSQSIQSLQGTKQGLGLLNVAFDRLEQLTQSFGYDARDNVLQQISQRLTNILRETDIIAPNYQDNPHRTVARIEGSQFCIVLNKIRNIKETETIARRIQRAFSKPFIVDNNEFFITTSIGIVVCPIDGTDRELLMEKLAATTEYAKQLGANQIQYYAKELNQQNLKKIQLETDLRKALANNEFEIHYQPKIELKTQTLAGMEALLRWNHPEHGMISPATFIPLAEELELIVPIGRWILERACSQTALWAKQSGQPLKLSVNVSPLQLLREDFYATVKKALENSALPGDQLILEITESMVQEKSDDAVDLLNLIKSLGPSFAIDDFGTGYSSFSSLGKLPISELKIDRSLIIDIAESDEGIAIVKAIIAMANSLGLNVVAEGIESKEEADALFAIECEMIQGFYYSKPLPAEQFYQYLVANC